MIAALIAAAAIAVSPGWTSHDLTAAAGIWLPVPPGYKQVVTPGAAKFDDGKGGSLTVIVTPHPDSLQWTELQQREFLSQGQTALPSTEVVSRESAVICGRPAAIAEYRADAFTGDASRAPYSMRVVVCSFFLGGRIVRISGLYFLDRVEPLRVTSEFESRRAHYRDVFRGASLRPIDATQAGASPSNTAAPRSTNWTLPIAFAVVVLLFAVGHRFANRTKQISRRGA